MIDMADQQQYDNEMRGVLFRNDKKEKDTHPDYKGNATVSGVEFWLSAWVKTKKDGSGKYMSLSFQKKDVQPAGEKPAAENGGEQDDLPF